VRGASALGAAARISPLVVGTFVAYGTSAPEFVVSLQSSLRGQPDIALGNVVGSNVFNILGVLGVSGLVSGQGVAVTGAALLLDIPVMIAVAVACLPIFFTGHRIARWEGGLFFGFFLAYSASSSFLSVPFAAGHSGSPQQLPVARRLSQRTASQPAAAPIRT